MKDHLRIREKVPPKQKPVKKSKSKKSKKPINPTISVYDLTKQKLIKEFIDPIGSMCDKLYYTSVYYSLLKQQPLNQLEYRYQYVDRYTELNRIFEPNAKYERLYPKWFKSIYMSTTSKDIIDTDKVTYALNLGKFGKFMDNIKKFTPKKDQSITKLDGKFKYDLNNSTVQSIMDILELSQGKAKYHDEREKNLIDYHRSRASWCTKARNGSCCL